MSSPPLNCFLAAARTASLIASITRSRSMPCSWQRASMFCAMVVLILKDPRHPAGGARAFPRADSSLTILSNQIPVNRFTFVCLTKLAVHVNFKVRLDDRFEGYFQTPAGSIVESHLAVSRPGYRAAKISLVADRDARFDFRRAARKPFIISQ